MPCMLITIMVLSITPKVVNNSHTLDKKVTKYVVQKDSVEYYPLSEIMAAIAYHECANLSKLERWLVMEAFHNRIVDNFNNNGSSMKDQLLAPKQFTGLWKFRPNEFKYDSLDTISVQNKQMAEHIINGARLSEKRIYYWAGVCDKTTKHGKWVEKDHLKLPNFVKHKFR